jgi:hypothetical protein
MCFPIDRGKDRVLIII